MRPLLIIAACTALAACGVETAGTAATAATIKQQEIEQAQRTMQQAQHKIDGAMQQMQQRSAAE